MNSKEKINSNNLDGKNILIESGGGVGDLIMFTPALRRLKEKYPNCVITFLTIDKNADIIRRIPYIDKVICIKRGHFMGRYRVLPNLMRQDYMIFTEWQPHLLFFAWILHLPNRFSIPRIGNPLTHTLHKQITDIVSKSRDFAAKTNTRLIGDALEISLSDTGMRCDVSLPNATERMQVDQLLLEIGIDKDINFIALSPFTSADERDWPLSEAKKLVEMIQDKYHLPVVIIGNKKVIEDISQVSQYSLLGRTNIMQLIEIIRRAKCLVSPDSGPIHIAGALNTPCVALFSRDLPSRWAPKNNCYPIYLNYSCSPCESEIFKNCPHELACIRKITADMVMEKLSLILTISARET